MMTRREFVEYCALVGAGAAALPNQIDAFTRLYEANMPRVATGLLNIHDISFGFNQTPMDASCVVLFLRGEQVLLRVPINTRATCRFVTAPEVPLIALRDDFRWQVTHDTSEGKVASQRFNAQIRCVETGKVYDRLCNLYASIDTDSILAELKHLDKLVA